MSLSILRGLASALVLVVPALSQVRFPAPITPQGNPIAQDKALLGMALFWEEQLSSSNTIACGTCHQFQNGGVDPRAGQRQHPGLDGLFGTPDDIDGSPSLPRRGNNGRYVGHPAFGMAEQVTSRKAPSVVNAAYHTELFYDGRATGGAFRDPVTNQQTLTGPVTLENLVLQPPVNPAEMAHAGRTWSDVLARLRSARPLALASELPDRLRFFIYGRSYPDLFRIAFGDPEVTATRVAMAIATYLRTLLADGSRFDLFLTGAIALTPTELQGMAVFNATPANAASCVSCHGDVSRESHRAGPHTMQATLPVYYGPARFVQNYANIGVRPIAEDPGRANGEFRVPALRNVALHGRYFHNGGMSTLEDVVEFYDRGGDFHAQQSAGIQPRSLTTQEKAALVTFLHALTDPRVASGIEPFDQPRLSAASGLLLPRPFGPGMTGRDNRVARAVGLDPVFGGNPGCAVGLTDVPRDLPVFALWDLSPSGGFTLFGLRMELGLGATAIVGLGTTEGPTPQQGHASMAMAIPPQPELRGFQIYLQWLLLDPTLPVGAYTSTALELTVR